MCARVCVCERVRQTDRGSVWSCVTVADGKDFCQRGSALRPNEILILMRPSLRGICRQGFMSGKQKWSI